MPDAPPPSFGDEEEWNPWVLEHGLPDPPSRLLEGLVVPVARWAGPRFGAVLSVWLRTPDEGDDDDEEPYPDSEVELYRRVADGWEEATGSGGSSWFAPPFERPSMDADQVGFTGETGAGGLGWYACGIEGIAGADAVTVEVEDDDGVTSNPVESPFGAFVVAFDGSRPAVVRVRNRDGVVLGETGFGGYEWAAR